MDTINGHLILLMAPSGSGKGSIVNSLGSLSDKIYFAKTYTTRKQREGVVENPKYTFVTRESFEKNIETGDFIEWANFGGNLYGTPRAEFVTPLSEGRVVFKEMELQGIQQVQKLLPKENITIVYIEAGGWDTLKNRILQRAAISDNELELRGLRYIEESKAKNIADVIIDNSDGKLEQAQTIFITLVEDALAKVST